MHPHVWLGLLALLGYFVGSIPFGLLIGFSQGKDIRLEGSKNIGATNAGRVLGKKFFWIVFFLDMFKSLIPMLIASAIVARMPEWDRSALTYTLWLGVGIAALLGHVFSLYLKFTGGKGVASGAGVLLGLWPYFTVAGLVAVAVFLVVVLLTRYISLGSIAAAVVFPAAYVVIELSQGRAVLGEKLPLLVLALFLCALVIWRHRENIVRLRAGTESKVGRKKPQPAP